MHRIAFVLEQSLGHVTFARNFRPTVDADPDVLPTWIPVEYSRGRRCFPASLLDRNWSVRASRSARRALRDAGAPGAFDTVLFHTQVTALASAGLLRTLHGVVSLDATPRNYDAVGAAYDHVRAPRAVELVKDAVNRRAFRAAAHLVTWSDWARRSLVRDYGLAARKVTTIPPGTQLDLWEPRGDRPANDVPRLLFVGGDFARKGGTLLLDVYRHRLARSCTLDIVTGATVHDVPEGVTVHRSVGANSAALRRLFALADVFVLPTRADCLPLVLMEAMAAGLPVVTTDIAAIGEAVRHGENGLLIPPNDGRALSEALGRLFADPSLRLRMARASRARAELRFDARENGRRLLTVLKACADRRGDAPRPTGATRATMDSA